MFHLPLELQDSRRSQSVKHSRITVAGRGACSIIVRHDHPTSKEESHVY